MWVLYVGAVFDLGHCHCHNSLYPAREENRTAHCRGNYLATPQPQATAPSVVAESTDTAAVAAQLQPILADPAFQSTPKLSALLAHIVNEALAGRGQGLKATAIAQAVFGRDESFDSQTDTIVRVEAGRLRRRLAKYYDRNGLDDPVTIEIPKGGYTPTLLRRDSGAKTEAAPENTTALPGPVTAAEAIPASRAAARLTRLLVSFMALAALFLVAATWYRLAKEAAPVTTEIAKPFVMVQPLRHEDGEQSQQLALRSIQAVRSLTG